MVLIIAAFAGSVLLLVGAVLHYTSRPDLFPGIDELFSPGSIMSMLAGLASVGLVIASIQQNLQDLLGFLIAPAGFSLYQWIGSMTLIRRVSRAENVRIGPGPGMVLTMLGALIVGVVAFLSLPEGFVDR
ncbi:hypothetical protein [Actinophytocola sediminis]